MAKSFDSLGMAQSLASELEKRGATRDLGATFSPPDAQTPKDVRSLEQDMERLGELLDLPRQVWESVCIDAEGTTIDDVLADLFKRSLIDQRQLLSAHVGLGLDVGDDGKGPGERYRKLSFFDAGGVGELYVAKDLVLRRKVAVKQIKSSQAWSSETLERFRREAQITAQLDHPNIVPIYSLEVEASGEERLSYAMKLISGKTLALVIDEQRNRLELAQPDSDEAMRARLEILIKVCDAVDFAHSRSVVHRDLKPQNIMIGSFGEVYVMDWGLARLKSSAEEVDGPFGTPLYMSPEQARTTPESLAPTSDVYTLGLIFFELCTLQQAVEAETLQQAVWNAIEGNTRPFEHIKGKALSEDLRAIFQMATHVDPAKRYSSAKALADDIRRFLHGEELAVRPDNAFRKVLRWIVRHRQVTLLIVMALVLALAGAIIWSLHSQQATMAAAKLREERIMGWRSDVGRRAGDLDRLLLRVGLLTQRLGRSVESLLAHPITAGGLQYPQNDLDRPGEAPPDYADAPSHGRKASFDEPVYSLPAGVNLDAVQPTLARLYPLRDTFRGLFLDYRNFQGAGLAVGDVQLFRQDLLPVRWAYVALESGLFITYPGTSGLHDDFDARRRPWYLAGRQGAGELVWAAPYYGVHDGLLCLPALLAVHGDDGGFLGVVGMEVAVGQLVELMLQQTDSLGLKSPNRAGVVLSVLDKEGNVMTSSGRQAAAPLDLSRSDAVVLEVYEHPEVIEATKRRHSGFVEIRRGGEWHFVAYESLPTLGWTYVEETSGEDLLGTR